MNRKRLNALETKAATIGGQVYCSHVALVRVFSEVGANGERNLISQNACPHCSLAPLASINLFPSETGEVQR